MLSFFFDRGYKDEEYKRCNASILIQTTYRGYVTRKSFKNMVKGFTILQKKFKIYLRKKQDKEMELMIDQFTKNLIDESINKSVINFKLQERMESKNKYKNKIKSRHLKEKKECKPYCKINKYNSRIVKPNREMFRNIVFYKENKSNNIFDAKYRYRKNLSINVSSPVIKPIEYDDLDIQENLPCIDNISPLCTPYYGSFMNTKQYRKKYKAYINNCNRKVIYEKKDFKPFTCFYSIREGLKEVGNGIVKLLDCISDMVQIENEMAVLEEETERLLDDKFHEQERRRIKYKTI